MRILILSDLESPHTTKWVKSLAELNYSIGIFSIHNVTKSIPYINYKNIKIYNGKISSKLKDKSENNLIKLNYLKMFKYLKLVIDEFKPDIVHSHYATSYGLLGALTGFHPYIISAWGTDVYSFPNKSFFHQLIFKYNLSKSDSILSTSKAMRDELTKYTSRKIIVTPFGININKFKPEIVKSIFSKDDFVIGIIKTLEKNYGIEFLIKAFKKVKNNSPLKSLKLMITGKGSQELFLKNLVSDLKIVEDVVFTGYIEPDLVPDYLNMLDVTVFPSIEESFGVAVLEASACARPVIVTNVGGLPEVVENGKTGFIIEKENSDAIALALEKFISNPELKFELGINGRQKVIQEYNWDDSIKQMISVYEQIIINN